MAVGCRQVIRFLLRNRRARHRKVMRWMIPVLALLLPLSQIPAVLQGPLPVRISPWVVSSIPDYECAARWLNENTRAEDLVITYWNLGWLLKARNAAWAGYPAGDYFPTPPAHARFRYAADLNQAKFFAITELDEHWAFAQGQVLLFLRSSGVEKWPLVYQAGPIKVLANPGWRSP
jgi:hypothetical protein